MEHWLEEVKKLRAEGSFAKTMAFLTEVLKRYPQDPSVYYQIAWTHDALGKEADAAPEYEKAIAMGLSGEDLQGAYIGLGSTYRCLGEYEKSSNLLSEAISQFPNNGALKAFFALTQFNLNNYTGAVETLLKELVRSSSDHEIRSYGRALLFYSDKLEKKFD